MQRGHQQHRAGKGVRRDHPVVRLGIGGDAAAFGEPARPGDVGLHDIDRAAGDQLAEAVEADLGLVAGDRRVRARRRPAALPSMSSVATGSSIQ